jgi:esterase/lipase superfamily enzyme
LPGFLAAFLIIGVMLAGCGQRGTIVADPQAADVGTVHRIFVASSRAPAPDAVDFLRAAGMGLSYAQFDVSVPPERKIGTVTLPDPARPDPKRDFLVVDSTRIADQSAFVRSIDEALVQLPRSQREVLVFVHGFNTNFAEGLYRHAQMRHDFRSPGVSVHYAWPSAARAASYATDRESVLQARDDLDALIGQLERTKAGRIVVAGHSMGAFLVMETLRQRAIRARPGSFDKTPLVILMAPDIDVGVFRGQAESLAAEDVAIYIFTSARDRALRFSAVLRGTGARLGALTDQSQLPGLPVTVVDLSSVAGNQDSLNHFKVATSPVMISVVGGMSTYGNTMLSDAIRKPGLIEGGIGIVRDVTTAALAPVTER